jgi:hypothetical protein
MGKHVKALLVMEPTDFSTFPKTKDPKPDHLDIAPRRNHRVWDPREHSTALQLVYVLHHLHNLKYFLFLAASRSGSRFQDTFICFFNRLAARETEEQMEVEVRPLPLPLLGSVEEVDISRIRYPNQGSFMHVFVYRPNIQSLSISQTVPVLKLYFRSQPGINTSSIRKLTISSPIMLMDSSTLVRLPKTLEVLSLHLCPMFFFRPDEQIYLEAALQTQATNLKELRSRHTLHDSPQAILVPTVQAQT